MDDNIKQSLNNIINGIENEPSNSERYTTLTQQLRDTGVILLVNNPQYCKIIDLCNNIWKYCFYNQISNYRKNLKHNANKSIENKYESHLCDSIKYWEILLKDIDENNNKSNEECINGYIKHNINLYIGDLYRYYSQIKVNSEKQKMYENALKYYKNGIDLNGENGICYNQIGVIYCYENKPIYCLYFYILSYNCKNAFVTSENNIKSLLNKMKNGNINDIMKIKDCNEKIIRLYLYVVSNISYKNKLDELKSEINNYYKLYEEVIKHNLINNLKIIMLFIILIHISVSVKEDDNYFQFVVTMMSEMMKIMLKYSAISIGRNSWFKEVRNDLKHCSVFHMILYYFHITRINEKYSSVLKEMVEELTKFRMRINIDNYNDKTDQIFLLNEEKELFYFLPFKPIITIEKSEVTETPLRSQIIRIEKIKEISKYFINDKLTVNKNSENVKSIEMIKNEVPKYSRFKLNRKGDMRIKLESIETSPFIYKRNNTNITNIIL